jgi:GntR family transcriptional regulator
VRLVAPLHLHKTVRRAERARHVRDLLRMEILSGVHGWALLPSEAELTIRFATSRNALRDALDLLRREGIVERVPGAGTFIVRAKAIHRHDRIQGLADNLEDGHRRVTVSLLDVELLPAPGPVAAKLEIEPGSEVVFLERRLLLDGEPLSVWSSYLPADLAGSLVGGDLSVDFYELIEDRLGMQLGSAEFATEARLADDLIAELLDVEAGGAILFLERLLRQRSGRPLEFGFVYLRGDRIQFVALVTRPTAGDRS